MLKIIKGDSAQQAKILDRESNSHPLTMHHPNIIETHVMTNPSGARFLVEAFVPPLSDRWKSDGIDELTNLLYDITNALTYIHGRGYVHGDIKPDNIARRNETNNYLLLDFGNCRPMEDLSSDVSGTGSLRTRAPELFESGSYINLDVQKMDVWALGATAFNSIVGRFPLFKLNESPPPVSEEEHRKEFEEELRRRVKNDWDDFVAFDSVPEKLRGLLSQMLDREPRSRPTAPELDSVIKGQLSIHLRQSWVGDHMAASFSVPETLQQMERVFNNNPGTRFMPSAKRMEFMHLLHEMNKGAKLETQSRVQRLIETIQGA